MSKHGALKAIADRMRSEIKLIREFAVESDSNLAGKLPKKPDTPFRANEQEELRRVAAAILAATKESPKGGATEFSATLSDRVGKFVLQAVMPVKQRTFLAEMALAYLVSHLEEFIKTYMYRVLVDNPRMLRSGATLSYEEALSFSSMKALRSGLADREVESLGYGSIDDVATYFLKKLGIELSTFSQWQSLREHIYRRNLIVHNQGRINDIYRRKVQYKGTRVHLSTDMVYVGTAAETMLAFVDHVHAEVTLKLRLNETKPGGRPRSFRSLEAAR